MVFETGNENTYNIIISFFLFMFMVYDFICVIVLNHILTKNTI